MTDSVISHTLSFSQPFNHAEQQLLTPEAVSFLEALVARFAPQRNVLLSARQQRQQQYDQGYLPDFDMETASIRSSEWRIQPIPADLEDRRVEITGPPERKMVINALNANVKVFMADFEDSLSPEWSKLIDGQLTLREAVHGTLRYTSDTGKIYQLGANPAVLMCRVRGLHLPEKHVSWQGEAIPGGLFDFALYFFHNVRPLLAKGSGPYFYLPKTESWQEIAWWREIFSFSEDQFDLPRGTIKATVLIETLPAVFQMDEILWNLRDHIVGLNCGRWDYIFSYIKTLKQHPDRVLPDRQSVTMSQPFLDAYSRLLIKTCHRRGAFAMGGMSALIPAKDPTRNAWVLQRVTEDKQREAGNGHDGTWIAHPGLADTAMAIFNAVLGDRPNQLHVMREEDAAITAEQLLAPCMGERTEAGMRANIRVALQYLEAWISGNGCVPIDGLMEDAATAEIARTSIWQWIRHQQMLNSGQQVTAELFLRWLSEELHLLQNALGEARFSAGRYNDAAQLMAQITTERELVSFLTLPGYRLIP
ncbi:malate synthase A [Pantoea sp. Bo_2]|uniref:Malate synthase n=2 Tax=Pantoea TaxID=53335 RepID=A0AB34CE97_9GAMM|nr:malate synthase A [Pantoea sp. VH_8]KAA5948046.1 malate synthase A [Pantoea sp. VH_3]KAA5952554.1 malate synthase A [Pantoea sp. VH_25]KAA5958419.1 malate synthase A [Pantoea sp. VH_24]KAA5962162.1 malate synthase A [Pantoea sp. VH_16]KAA5965889.1 malate synthase A [Pantoea sp. VH_18]KAA5982039.1 malate synthase A [Pantoea sp. M_4]KAA5982965.1 malate synthase A [Pantoea sp. M_3]KAA6000469.1 malate synthase A [Pantoea sp. M_1]KAA6001738.1 malate synthase A [Pantoea sp. F_7]KAA6009760.1 